MALSLRHLKAALVIADTGSVTRAAAVLNRTQSAVTKSLNELESSLGASLFDRSARGMLPTAPGSVFVARIREAAAQFALAETAWLAVSRNPPTRRHNPVFTMELSQRRLAAFLALHDTRDIAAAAAHLGISRAALYGSLRQLEGLLQLRLFEHAGPRLASTTFADVLATQLKLAFSLIRHGLDELASGDGVTRGSVVIGTLPYSRTLLTPRTIHLLLADHPQLRIATREGPYPVLETGLRTGELDLIVGATREHDAASLLATEPLFEDELAVIAGAGHPLATRKRIALRDLLQFGWILPHAETPARHLFDRYLARHGAGEPAQVVETSSMSTIRGLLLVSDRVALLSRHQALHDEQAGLLVTLPIRLEGTRRPIGITTRTHTTPSPAARLFIEYLRRQAASLG
jgi:LysR family transcriptional regulator of gallate degradation